MISVRLNRGRHRKPHASAIRVFQWRGLKGSLQGTHRIVLFTGHSDDSATSWHIEDVIAMMSHDHELGQRWVPEDGVVRQADVSDVEVDELGAVVAAGSEGDREADLPDRDRGTVGDSREKLGWLKLVVGYLKIVECFTDRTLSPAPPSMRVLVTSTLLMTGEQSIGRTPAMAAHLS